MSIGATIAFLRRLSAGQSGSVALIVGLLLPILGAAALGAVDIASVMAAKQQMKAVAGAKQLLMDTSPATSDRTQNFAQAQLESLASWHPTVTAQVVNNATAME